MTTGFDLPEDVDLALVLLDDERIDALARRAPGYASLGAETGDPALELLGALAAEVDLGLEDLMYDLPPLPAAGPDDADAVALEALPLAAAVGQTPVDGHPAVDGPPTRSAARPRHLRRAGVVVAAVVGSMVSVSGVAAAVTGNPLEPYQKVATTVASALGHGPNEHAADRAKLQAKLRDAARLIRAQHYAEAQALLDDVTADMPALPAKQRAGVARQVERLQGKLDQAVTQPGTSGTGGPGTPQIPSPFTHGSPSHLLTPTPPTPSPNASHSGGPATPTDPSSQPTSPSGDPTDPTGSPSSATPSPTPSPSLTPTPAETGDPTPKGTPTRGRGGPTGGPGSGSGTPTTDGSGTPTTEGSGTPTTG